MAQVVIITFLSRKTTSQLRHDHPHPAHVTAGRGSQAVQTLHGGLQGEPEKLPPGPESDGGAGTNTCDPVLVRRGNYQY